MYAKMAYYYNIPWYEVDEMPMSIVGSYMDCLEIIHSQEALVDIETSSFPNIKSSKDKSKILKKYEDKAFKLQSKNIIKIDDMIGKLKDGI